MKKLVIINFDDQYINTSNIIFDILNEELVKKNNLESDFSIDDFRRNGFILFIIYIGLSFRTTCWWP